VEAQSWLHEKSYGVGWIGSVVECSDLVVVGWKDLSVVGRAEVLYYIAVAVVSEAYSRDERSVKGEVAIVIRHPAEGNAIAGVEDWV
jgi:hypothetical protein